MSGISIEHFVWRVTKITFSRVKLASVVLLQKNTKLSSLRFSPNSCKCVRSRFAYHNWKFLQFQWVSVYSFTLSNLDCLKKCPIRQLRVLTLASTSSATKWVHRFFIFTSFLSQDAMTENHKTCKLMGHAFVFKVDYSNSKKEKFSANWHRPPSRFSPLSAQHVSE